MPELGRAEERRALQNGIEPSTQLSAVDALRKPRGHASAANIPAHLLCAPYMYVLPHPTCDTSSMAATVATLLLAAVAATPCPPSHLLDDVARSTPELTTLLRACALEAERHRALLTAVKAVLASGDSPGIVAAARAVIATADAPLAPLPSPPPSPPSQSAARSPARNKLTTWHASAEEQQQAQHAQATVVQARYGRAGREQKIVPSVALAVGETRRWPVTCDPQLYRLGLPPVDGCTPALGIAGTAGAASNAGGTAVPCGRAMRDHVLSGHERRTMVGVFERAMRGLFHQGASTSFAPEATHAAKHMGHDGVALFGNVSERVRALVEGEFGTRLYTAGALLTRLWADDRVPSDGMDVCLPCISMHLHASPRISPHIASPPPLPVVTRVR